MAKIAAADVSQAPAAERPSRRKYKGGPAAKAVLRIVGDGRFAVRIFYADVKEKEPASRKASSSPTEKAGAGPGAVLNTAGCECLAGRDFCGGAKYTKGTAVEMGW